jgi:hypothetical protein
MKKTVTVDLKSALVARAEAALQCSGITMAEAVEQMLVMIAMHDEVERMHPFYADALDELRTAPGDGSETLQRLLDEDDARSSNVPLDDDEPPHVYGCVDIDLDALRAAFSDLK